MKISNIISKQNFKGYDAIPLKKLHMNSGLKKIEDELKIVANYENFEIKSTDYNEPFNQDLKVILNDGKTTKLFIEDGFGLAQTNLSSIQKDYNMPVEIVNREKSKAGFLSGGNFFLGKFQNGEKWILAGELEEILAPNKKLVSEMYDVKEKNIFYINQQDYHLDLSIRPIGFPYVLVNNPEMCLKNELKAKGIKKNSKPTLDSNSYKMKSYKESIKQLKEAGFYPIPIAGVYDNGINFINAIVNKHEDGSISYITNSSKCNNPIVSKMQKLFERDLRNKLEEINKIDSQAPKLKNIHFIHGETYKESNEIMDNLLEGAGGVHCMCLEEPNFEAWV